MKYSEKDPVRILGWITNGNIGDISCEIPGGTHWIISWGLLRVVQKMILEIHPLEIPEKIVEKFKKTPMEYFFFISRKIYCRVPGRIYGQIPR